MSMQSDSSEYGNKREWNIESQEVTMFQLGYIFTLFCQGVDNDELQIVIETSFTIRYPDRTVNCEPENVDSMKETLQLLRKSLSTLTAYRDGRLLLTFLDGTELEVSKHPQYESWEVFGKGALEDVALLCSPHDGPPWAERLA